MPRPKKVPEYLEGPQAAENFVRTMRTLVNTPRQTMTTHTAVTTEVTAETRHVVRSKKKDQKMGKARRDR
jgi:hypothetical protein